jgi:hypothetical protein
MFKIKGSSVPGVKMTLSVYLASRLLLANVLQCLHGNVLFSVREEHTMTQVKSTCDNMEWSKTRHGVVM